MPRYAAKADANQAAIVETLRRFGLSVLHLHTLGHGCPDLCVGGLDRNRNEHINVLVEVKAPGGILTPDEVRFRGEWRGAEVLIAYDAESILRWFGIE